MIEVSRLGTFQKREPRKFIDGDLLKLSEETYGIRMEFSVGTKLAINSLRPNPCFTSTKYNHHLRLNLSWQASGIQADGIQSIYIDRVRKWFSHIKGGEMEPSS